MLHKFNVNFWTKEIKHAYKNYYLDHLNSNTYNLFHNCVLKQPKKQQIVQKGYSHIINATNVPVYVFFFGQPAIVVYQVLFGFVCI